MLTELYSEMQMMPMVCSGWLVSFFWTTKREETMLKFRPENH